jgi:Tfp pilus assembly protein PilF
MSPSLLIAIIVALTTIGYVWSQQLSGPWFHVRFALLPIVGDRFTVDQYSLLSPLHLLDVANLAIVLCPALVLVALSVGKAKPPVGAARSYLLLLLVPACLLAFLLDPKLGMPRDWDLLAFAGPPLTLATWYLLIQPRVNNPAFRFAVSALLVLQGLVFLSRAETLACPQAGVEQAMALFKHAPGRSRTGWGVLSTYYVNQGDTLAARLTNERRAARYPEEQLSRSAQKFIEKGDIVRGKAAAQETLRRNPRVFEAWVNLGRALRQEGKYDSSLVCMQVADGLNPYGLITTVELGMSLLKMGDIGGAEETWLKSLSIDSSHFIAYGALAELYGQRGDSARQMDYLERGLARTDAESWAALSLGHHYARRGQSAKLEQLLHQSESRGFDTSITTQLKELLTNAGR